MDYESLEGEEDVVRATWYGDPGTRKTTYMASLAKLGPILHIDTEGGLKKTALERQGIPVENISVMRDVTYTKLEDLIYQLKGNQADGDPFPFIGINIDSMTAGIDKLLSNLVDQAVARAAKKGEERSKWKTYQDDYGDMTSQWKDILRGLRDLDLHLGISAHAKRDKDEEDRIRVGPHTTPALAQPITGYVDVILHTVVVDTKVDGVPVGYGDCAPVGKYDGKERFGGAIPPRLIQPSFDRLIGYVRGTLTRENDTIQEAARQAMAPGSKTTTPTAKTKEQ